MDEFSDAMWAADALAAMLRRIRKLIEMEYQRRLLGLLDL